MAKTLDYLFYDAIGKLTDLNMINQIEVFINIAFRAQTQCRKTLAVLAELKHPRRTTFIKQQNNAITQQVNNEAKSNPKNFEKVANELLEIKHKQRLDTKTAPASITTDPEMATVEICRRKTPEGKAISRQNSYKHGARCAEVRGMARQLTEWKRTLNQRVKFI